MKINKLISWKIPVIIFYSVLVLFTVFHHEPWRDEAQAWLIARDIPLFSIFTQMGYEGSPALWHIILTPFVKSGLPYITENLLHALVAIFIVIIFIYKSPLPIFTKILFVFSYFMAYEYAVIARSYNLSILLLFLIATYYGKRFESPVRHAIFIFLLYNTNVHSFFIASSLLIVFVYEGYINKYFTYKFYGTVSLIVLGALTAFFQILPYEEAANTGILNQRFWYAPGKAVMKSFFPLYANLDIYVWLGLIPVLLTIVYLVKVSWSALFILLFSYAGLSYIFIFKHFGGLRHQGFILIILIFVIWISTYYYKKETLLKIKIFPLKQIKLLVFLVLILNTYLLISIWPAFRFHYNDYKHSFSGSKEMAKFLNYNSFEDKILVADRSSNCSGLLPHLTVIFILT
ncbi:hypothetical protein ACFLS9_07950 [Bacteroidota bacterium]